VTVAVSAALSPVNGSGKRVGRARARTVGAILALAALPGCGTVSSLNPFSSSAPAAAAGAAPTNAAACPPAVVLRPLANTAVFGSGEARRQINVAFYGRLSDVDVKCDFAGGRLRAAFDVVVVAERGPAARGNGADFEYFVAVTGPDQAILSKNNFTVHIDVPANAKRAAVTDHIEEAIDTAGRPAGDLTIDVGFQQSPEAAEFYKASGGR
jgi:hypothetical protein